MSAKRIVTVVLGVSAGVWLILRGGSDPQPGDPRPALVSQSRPLPAEATDPSPGRIRSMDTDVRAPASPVGQSPPMLPQPADAAGLWGRDFNECIAKQGLSGFVCKQRFEPRDPAWALGAEQRIRDFVADTPLLVLPAEDDPSYRLECRATYCEVHLSVDQARLTDYWRSLGRYEEDSRLSRASEFAYVTRLLTLQPRLDGEQHRGWADDRAEELRLALVSSGLLGADATVDVLSVEPTNRKSAAFLRFRLSRCPDIDDLCAAN